MTRGAAKTRALSAAASLAVFLAPLAASGQPDGDEPDRDEASDEAGSETGDPTTVGVFVVGASGKISRARQATALLTMESALKSDERLSIVDKDLRLLRRAGRIPTDEIAAARALLETGVAQIEQGKAKSALKSLLEAREMFTRLVTFAEKDDLARAQYLVGVAHVALGRTGAGKVAFEKLLVWHPEMVPSRVADATLYKKVTRAWRGAKNAVARKKRGAIDLATKPASALAYIDGRFLGFTPTSAEDLAVGTHYVRFKLSGYSGVVVPARVTRKGRRKVEVKLDPSPEIAEVQSLSSRAAERLGKKTMTEKARAAIRKLGGLLDADQIVIVEIPAAGEETYRAAVFDSKTGRRLRRVTTKAEEDQLPEDLFGGLARSLYADLDLSAPLPPAPVAKKKKSKTKKKNTAGKKDTPLYRKWWFWTGLGVVAAASIIVPVAILATDSDQSCAPGAVCGEVVFRF